MRVHVSPFRKFRSLPSASGPSSIKFLTSATWSEISITSSPSNTPGFILRSRSLYVTSITLLSTIDMVQRLGVFVGHGMERPTLEVQHRRTDEVYGSAGGDVGSK